MRKPIAAALIALFSSTAACSHDRDENAGPVVSRAYPVGNFTALEAAGPFDVTVRTGAKPGVQVRGKQKLIDKLTVEVKGDKLLIRPEENRGWFHWGHTRGKAQIDVTVPELRAATLAGAGGINIDRVQGDSFKGSIAGSGDLTMQSIDVGSLKVDIAGSGSVSGQGKAESADYGIAGSGDVDAERIIVQDLKVGIAGSGNVRAHATRAAKVDIMGAGDVEVKGGAKCSVSKMGGGDVRCS